MLVSILLLSIYPGFSSDFPSSPMNYSDNIANITVSSSSQQESPRQGYFPQEVLSANETPDIQGIWKFSLAGMELTFAINQSGDSIFGRAKYEGEEPWNGVIAGSLSGQADQIALAALQEDVLVSMEISGTVVDDSMKGTYVRSNSNGTAAKGDFTAVRISPDTSVYAPAEIGVYAKDSSGKETDQMVQGIYRAGQRADSQSETGAGPAISTRKSGFTDVKELAKGIDPNIMPRYAPL